MTETPQDNGDVDRLRGLLSPDSLSIEIVSAFSGDRPLTENEKAFIAEQKIKRTDKFFSDILYAVTHHYFAPMVAEMLWNEVLRNKYEMSKALNRNVGITVAALDCLSNLKSELVCTTLVGEAHFAKIVNLSMRDGLTGLFNHTSFIELVELQVGLYKRHRVVMSVIIIDIDGFKKINDIYGHQEGDKILVNIATTMKQVTRESDICCRYGGEEFAVIMPLTNAREAGDIAERLRAVVARKLPGGHDLTVSVGVATCGDGANTSYELIKRADNALYRAKNNGRNQVINACL